MYLTWRHTRTVSVGTALIPSGHYGKSLETRVPRMMKSIQQNQNGSHGTQEAQPSPHLSFHATQEEKAQSSLHKSSYSIFMSLHPLLQPTLSAPSPLPAPPPTASSFSPIYGPVIQYILDTKLFSTRHTTVLKKAPSHKDFFVQSSAFLQQWMKS